MSIGGTMFREAYKYQNIDESNLTRIRTGIGLENTGKKMAEIFKVLADPTRLKIVQALELEELCVCDIASLIGLTQPSISHHLKNLKLSGIVKYRKSGKMTIYSLKSSRISALLAIARDYVRN